VWAHCVIKFRFDRESCLFHTEILLIMVRNSKSTPSENKDNSSNQDKQDEVSDNKDDKIQDE
ncbi:3231_t:CDS:1, partial [Gigaspora rosea]